ncbi:MAG TPA: hypothetical protein VJ720_05420 [Chitinophaga sp.]|uniref:Uncharacterized protein n=1 Tax=Chitinophaga tropicalis TaxID=2683588 RepID=A0A7K1U715_9BACT|nr:hypothetical protein [Chitinophaga tropicalis]MVT10151.1 hypothetical protein [Chitinophaga tropicalis]HJT73433.1 hypothetical protein [Chitinophaga sp.]
MQDYSFMTTEEIFLLQDALKKNKKQIMKFILIGLTLILIAAFLPQFFLKRRLSEEEIEQSVFSYKNAWFWTWLLSFVLVLVFALIKVTDVRYFTIKKDLTALQKGQIQVPLETIYQGNNDMQTSFIVKQEGIRKRKRLFYWMRGKLEDFRSGEEVKIVYGRYSRVILAIDKV